MAIKKLAKMGKCAINSRTAQQQRISRKWLKNERTSETEKWLPLPLVAGVAWVPLGGGKGLVCVCVCVRRECLCVYTRSKSQRHLCAKASVCKTVWVCEFMFVEESVQISVHV